MWQCGTVNAAAGRVRDGRCSNGFRERIRDGRDADDFDEPISRAANAGANIHACSFHLCRRRVPSPSCGEAARLHVGDLVLERDRQIGPSRDRAIEGQLTRFGAGGDAGLRRSRESAHGL